MKLAHCRLALLLFPLLAQPALAGPPEMPLEARLDLAPLVVIGTITALTPVDENRGPGSHCARATVSVEETLKNPADQPATQVQFLVVTALDPGWNGAGIIRTHAVGERGIWIILGGYVIDSGMIDPQHAPEIRALVTSLANRKWTDPVHGLRAWAAVAKGDNSDDQLLFALQNTSKDPIYIPSEESPGFIHAAATDAHDKLTEGPLRKGNPPALIPCIQLAPHEIRYMHPGYTRINVQRDLPLPTGKFQVTVSCQNTQPQGELYDRDGRHPVPAWTGELKTDPLPIQIP